MVSDLFGTQGREILGRLAIPEPWATTLTTSLRMIDELSVDIAAAEADLRRLGADHPSIPLLLSMLGVGPLPAYTIASAVRSIAPDALLVANGFSCREQIAQSGGRRALHLAEVLEMALAPADGGD